MIMKGISLSQSNTFHPNIKFNRSNPPPINIINPILRVPRRSLRVISLSVDPSANQNAKPTVKPNAPPLVVVGSANADIYVEIERLPKEGETISAKTGQTLAGGKGANQAACGAKLDYPTYFVGRLGEDAHGKLIAGALGGGSEGCGVRLDHVKSVKDEPTGHAVVMLQSDGQNSIIIVGGANMRGWPEKMSDDELEVVRNAGVVLLQREIPDSVNVQVAKAVKKAGVPVILDVGGMDTPIPNELLDSVDILSPNETELSRLTGMPTETFEQISQAVAKCHKLGVKQVLVKLGSKGSALFIEGEKPIQQSIIPAAQVVDTTGAGDTFTAAFAVAMVEGKSHEECLRFADFSRRPIPARSDDADEFPARSDDVDEFPARLDRIYKLRRTKRSLSESGEDPTAPRARNVSSSLSLW